MQLDRPTLKKIKVASRRLGLTPHEFVDRCLAEGSRRLAEISRAWKKEALHTGIMGELDRVLHDLEEARAELMAIDSRYASLNFMAFEAFSRVGTKLMAYSGTRATAKDFQKRLNDIGIEYSLGAGELASFQELADRYLFRREQRK